MANPRSDPDDLTQPETEVETKVETEAPVVAEQGFYARWSQNKLASSRNDSLPQKSDELQQVSDGAEQKGSVPVDESVETTLPPIETLTEHSDLKDFMSSQVADELRLRALHKVFHTSKFNVCDGLDDYAENYRIFEPLGNIITADLRHQLERLKQTKTTEPEAASVEVEESDPQIPMAAEDAADIEDHDHDAITSEGVQNDLVLQVPNSE